MKLIIFVLVAVSAFGLVLSDDAVDENERVVPIRPPLNRPNQPVKRQKPCNPYACGCTKEYQPVCGSDGQTYGNQCMFLCARRCFPRLKIIAYTACSRTTPTLPTTTTPEASPTNSPVTRLPDSCVCTFLYAPVCGTDGKTYSNKCFLACEVQRTQNKDLQVAYTGECKPPCICTLDYRPVCGTDGVTYGNSCQLKCTAEERKDSTLAVSYEGECRSSSVPTTTVPSTAPVKCNTLCACNTLYQPVCGSDGKTYSNKCFLDCATNCDKSLKLASNGSCEPVVIPDPAVAEA